MEEMEKIEELIHDAVVNNLEGTRFLLGLEIETVQEAYNGIGPEFLMPTLRAKVTKHFATLAPAAVIHDLRNEFSDGTKEKFHEANREFLANCLTLVDNKYPWWRPKRYVARQVAHAFFAFVEGPAGWRAWLEAQNRHEKKMLSGNSAGETKK